jgi:hypothetical protein
MNQNYFLEIGQVEEETIGLLKVHPSGKSGVRNDYDIFNFDST